MTSHGIKTLQNVLPVFADADALDLREAFVLQETKRDVSNKLHVQIMAILIANLILMLADFRFGLPELRYVSVTVRGLTVLLTVALLPLVKDNLRFYKWFPFAMGQLFGLGYGIVLWKKLMLGLPAHGYLTECIFVLQLIIILGFSPLIGRRSIAVLTGLYGLALISFLTPFARSHGVFLVVGLCGLCSAAWVRILYLNLLRLQHGIEFDHRRRMLTKNLLEATLKRSKGDIFDAVKMRSSAMVVLLARFDLKSNQTAVVTETTFESTFESTFGATFGATFETTSELEHRLIEIEKLLNRHFTDGAEIFEWFNNEICLCIPYDSQNLVEAERTALRSLAFAKDLTKMNCLEGRDLSVTVTLTIGRGIFGLAGTHNSRHIKVFGVPIRLARQLMDRHGHEHVFGPAREIITTIEFDHACRQTPIKI
jgi:hypothetical protein